MKWIALALILVSARFTYAAEAIRVEKDIAYLNPGRSEKADL